MKHQLCFDRLNFAPERENFRQYLVRVTAPDDAVARHVTFTVQAPAGCRLDVLLDVPRRKEGLFVHVDVGELAPSQTLELVMELTLPPLPEGDRLRVGFGFSALIGESSRPYRATQELVYTCHDDPESHRDEDIAVRFAQIKFAAVLRECLRRNRDCDYYNASGRMSVFVFRMGVRRIDVPALEGLYHDAVVYSERLQRPFNDHEREQAEATIARYLRTRSWLGKNIPTAVTRGSR